MDSNYRNSVAFCIVFTMVLGIVSLYSCDHVRRDSLSFDTDEASRFTRSSKATDFLTAVAVRRQVAQLIDVGYMPNTRCDNYAIHSFNDFPLSEFVEIFDNNAGVSKCGLAASMLVKALEQVGIEAYTYNYGIDGTFQTHVLVIAFTDSIWTIHDSFVNYSITDSLGEPKEFAKLVHELQEGIHGNIRLDSDTVWRDVIMQTGYQELLSRVPSCLKDVVRNTEIDSLMAVPVCPSCGVLGVGCAEFAYMTIGDTLSHQSPLFLTQIGKVWGARPDSVQALVEVMLGTMSRDSFPYP
jgi:hypothetical protein